MASDYSGTTAHKAARRALLTNHRDGDPCPRCDQPMHTWQHLDADHLAYPHALYPRALPDALSHRACNRYAGVVLRELLRGVTITHGDDVEREMIRQRVTTHVTQRVHDEAERQAREPVETPTRTSRAW